MPPLKILSQAAAHTPKHKQKLQSTFAIITQQLGNWKCEKINHKKSIRHQKHKTEPKKQVQGTETHFKNSRLSINSHKKNATSSKAAGVSYCPNKKTAPKNHTKLGKYFDGRKGLRRAKTELLMLLLAKEIVLNGRGAL